MEEFLKSNYTLLTYSFEMVAVIAGIISYRKYKGTATTFFIKIVFYLFIVELIGSYSTYYDQLDFLKPLYNTTFRQNYWWFTLFFDIGFVVLISILFKKILKNEKNKLLLKYLVYVFLCFVFLYLIYNRELFFFQFFPLLQIVSAIIIIICSVLFFIELLLSDLILNFYKSVYFYIAVAIFCWWIITTPITFYDLYFRAEDWNFIILKWQIYLFANIFMYATFTIGLIVSKPESIKE